MQSSFVTDKSSGQPIELQITSEVGGSVTFRRKGGGRLTTLSKAEFDKRFERQGGGFQRRQPPAAAAAPASSGGFDPARGAPRPTPPPFDPTRGAPPATSNNDMRALHGKLDDIFDELRDVSAKVGAIYKVIAEGPRDVEPPPPAHDPHAGAPEATGEPEDG